MKIKSIVKSLLVTGAAVVVLGTAAFAWVKLAPRRVPAGQPPLATLSADFLPAFRNTFNAAEGRTRVLALLSPT